jgi:hypothetical protein
MSNRAVLFGLNYGTDPDARLYGCVNDVKNVASFLKKEGMRCDVYTDDNVSTRGFTTAQGITTRLQALARESRTHRLKLVWIHFSGHGTRKLDFGRDEKDGYDECIVPSDFKTRGVISDDIINSILSQFNPTTRIICIFDCCHSGTICDTRFSWETPRSFVVENDKCKIRAKTLSISGCLDSQYSADTWDSKRRMYAGAMTSELLNVLESSVYFSLNKRINKTVFKLIDDLRIRLKNAGQEQIPKLTSTYDLSSEPFML